MAECNMDFDGWSSWQDFDWQPDDSHGFEAAAHETPAVDETIREPVENEPNTWLWRCLGCDSYECRWSDSG